MRLLRNFSYWRSHPSWPGGELGGGVSLVNRGTGSFVEALVGLMKVLQQISKNGHGTAETARLVEQDIRSCLEARFLAGDDHNEGSVLVLRDGRRERMSALAELVDVHHDDIRRQNADSRNGFVEALGIAHDFQSGQFVHMHRQAFH